MYKLGGYLHGSVFFFFQLQQNGIVAEMINTQYYYNVVYAGFVHPEKIFHYFFFENIFFISKETRSNSGSKFRGGFLLLDFPTQLQFQ